MSAQRVVVATMWNGVEVLRVLGEGVADPDPAELDSIAAALVPHNCGVKPTVRVLEQARIPAYGEA